MFKKIKFLFINPFLIISTLIILLWIIIHKKTSLSSWNIPLGYSGDNLILHTLLKNYSEFNWLSPFHQKIITNLI